jgi:hypothetical protein
MNDETRRGLDLLAQGKITVDEAGRLLSALGAPSATDSAAAAATSDSAPCATPRYVRIAVHQAAKEGKRDKDVNIRVPIAIVRSGMRLGAMIPGLAGDQFTARMRERGLDVDFSKLDGPAIEAVLKELAETNIEIEDGRSQVRITCE